MAAVELELIAAMLETGDLSPITSGRFRAEHCLTNEGKALHHFLAGYKYITQEQGSVPTRNVILQRFSHLELPDARQPFDLDTLVHEVHVEATRASLRECSVDLAALAEAVDPLAEIDNAQRRLAEIAKGVVPDHDLGFDSHLHELLAGYERGELVEPGIPWPWPAFNQHTTGMQKGELIVVAGRPKSRKTFIALYLVTEAFMEHGARVLVFSPEMSPEMMMRRAVATAGRLRHREFKRGQLDPFEEQSFREVVDEFSGPERLFKFVKSTGKSPSFMSAKIEQYRPDLVLVDPRTGTRSGQRPSTSGSSRPA